MGEVISLEMRLVRRSGVKSTVFKDLSYSEGWWDWIVFGFGVVYLGWVEEIVSGVLSAVVCF